VHSSLVFTFLLYGSEVLCLREDLFTKLRTFHNSCCRAMCQVHKTRHHILTSKQFYKRIGIAPWASTTTVVYFAGPAACRACL